MSRDIPSMPHLPSMSFLLSSPTLCNPLLPQQQWSPRFSPLPHLQSGNLKCKTSVLFACHKEGLGHGTVVFLFLINHHATLASGFLLGIDLLLALGALGDATSSEPFLHAVLQTYSNRWET